MKRVLAFPVFKPLRIFGKEAIQPIVDSSFHAVQIPEQTISLVHQYTTGRVNPSSKLR